MDMHNYIDPEAVLREWRTRILNGFLIAVSLLALPALAAIFANAISNPDIWPLAISFSIVELILIALAVLRDLPIWMRAREFAFKFWNQAGFFKTPGAMT